MTAALIGALAIGLSLGMLGSGGSVLTVPILVYLLGQPEKVAIAGSLAIVGIISLFGALPYIQKKQVHWRSLALFGLPGMAGSLIGAQLSQFISGQIQMILFAIVMLLAATLMLRFKPQTTGHPQKNPAWWLVAAEGTAVGISTGLVGVGGGFLIVPALVILGRLPMRMAVGTSLLIIAMKSVTGLIGYRGVLGQLGLQLDWGIIGLFSLIGVAASYLGSRLAERIPQLALQRGFAAFLVVIGIAVLVQNLQ